MGDFPYTQVPRKLKSFMEKTQQVGKPEVADRKWLASVGFGASNDHTILPVLKCIGFVDQQGRPTDRWLKYRDKSQSRKVLAEGILQGYQEVFQTYPGAHERPENEMRNFFSTRSSAGERVISMTVTTFRTLCTLADFTGVGPGPSASEDGSPADNSEADHGITNTATQGLAKGITVNINIQLTLPDTKDEVVYDNLFAALKKHLLS